MVSRKAEEEKNGDRNELDLKIAKLYRALGTAIGAVQDQIDVSDELLIATTIGVFRFNYTEAWHDVAANIPGAEAGLRGGDED